MPTNTVPKPWWQRPIVVIGLVGSIASSVALFLYLYDIAPAKPVQLTIFVTDLNGNVVLENEGRLNLSLGNRSLNAKIGEDGRTNFPDITASNIGELFTIGLEAEGWVQVDSNNRPYEFTGEPVHIKVKRDPRLGTIKGVIRSQDGQHFIQAATILINAEATIQSDELGRFKILLDESMWVDSFSDQYHLIISHPAYETKTIHYSPGSSSVEINMTKIKPSK